MKKYCIAIKSEKQLNAEIIAAVDYVILCPENYTEITNYKLQITNSDKKKNDSNSWFSVPGSQLYLYLPVIAMSDDIKILRKILGDNKTKERFAGVAANNVYALKLAREYNYKVFKGPWMNTINDNFCDFENIILSPELTEDEYRQFKDWDKKNYFLPVFGYMPLMTLAHCPYKVNGFECNTKKCDAAKLQYKDELGNIMAFRRTKLAKCYFELLNSVPLNLLNYKNKIKPHFFFDMRETGAKEILNTIKLFKEPGNKEPQGKYTTGLYFKELK